MTEQSPKRKRYPSKLSVISITDEMREEMDLLLQEDKELTEAEMVRTAIKEYLSREKRKRQKGGR
jgi:metal-responsive CopG/Arc/MetJ family transcriptional regulator